jgi:carbonic anhydrase
VEATAKENVRMVTAQIAAESAPLRDMQEKGELKVVGAYYSLSTGEVDIWA